MNSTRLGKRRIREEENGMGQLYQLTDDVDELLSEAERAFDLSARLKSFRAGQTQHMPSRLEHSNAVPETAGVPANTSVLESGTRAEIM
ncbi:hypothetical protein [Pararhizobium gei]|uniref:hypothetical protein n=1 Tax=Pararhizobium gei TaxID=1395951 RepID=UPI0023DCC3C6|nr:hypothetical protein [Rhizobium gei]